MNIANAFNQGAALGRGIRDSRDNKAMAGFVSSGDYQGAQDLAAERGNVNQVQAIKDYVAKTDKAKLDQDAKDFELYGQIAFAAKNVPLEQRQSFITSRLQQAGKDPALAQQLSGVDDDTLTAFGQSALSVKDQLAQFTTETQNVNDSMITTRTNNFTGEATASNAFNVAPSYSDVTTRDNNAAKNTLATDTLAEAVRSNKANERINSRKAATAATTAAQGAKTTPGKTPIFGTGTDGQRVVMFPDGKGGMIQAPNPEGVEIEGDFFKSRQKALGAGRAKLELGRTKAGSALSAVQRKGKMLSDDIQKAVALVKDSNTGFLVQGRVTASQDTENLNKLIMSIKARVGFDELQEMRNNSPTGGALGQVSEREIDFLQALQGNFDRTQDPEMLKANLLRVVETYNSMMNDYETRYQQDYESGLFDDDGVNRPAPKPAPNIPAGAIAYLKANPNTTAEFDAMFGQGASQGVLGGG